MTDWQKRRDEAAEAYGLTVCPANNIAPSVLEHKRIAIVGFKAGADWAAGEIEKLHEDLKLSDERGDIWQRETEGLHKEIERLKAEARRERYQMADHGVVLMSERDAYRAQALKLAGALRYLLESSELPAYAEERQALAEFERLEKWKHEAK